MRTTTSTLLIILVLAYLTTALPSGCGSDDQCSKGKSTNVCNGFGVGKCKPLSKDGGETHCKNGSKDVDVKKCKTPYKVDCETHCKNDSKDHCENHCKNDSKVVGEAKCKNDSKDVDVDKCKTLSKDECGTHCKNGPKDVDVDQCKKSCQVKCKDDGKINLEKESKEEFKDDCTQYYTIGDRDTNFIVAKRFGFTWDEFKKINPEPLNGDYDLVFAGDKVCLGRPGTIPASKPDGTCKTKKVLDGQTCDQVAHANNLTPAQFQLLNRTVDCHEILPKGHEVIVSRGLHPHCKKLHQVVCKDNVCKVAEGHYIPLEELKGLNPGIDLGDLAINKEVCVEA